MEISKDQARIEETKEPSRRDFMEDAGRLTAGALLVGSRGVTPAFTHGVAVPGFFELRIHIIEIAQETNPSTKLIVKTHNIDVALSGSLCGNRSHQVTR